MVRRARNLIRCMRNETGVLINDEEVIKGMVADYFKQLFTKDEESDPLLALKGAFPRLHENTWRTINKPISNEEVKEAIMAMAPLKAPGLDGLHAMFYQKSWRIIEGSLVRLIKEFDQTGHLPKEINDTYLVLIPKVAYPEKVNQLRLISLCNVAYKAITKVMTCRIKRIIPNLVSPNQTSFIPNRQITDNIAIYQEVLHSMRTKKRGPGYMVIKIDLEKAYDRLDWDFIRDTLFEVGLNNTWVRNIMSCIETSRLSILWNGEKLNWFKPERGTRQGDPISPYASRDSDT